MPSSPAPPFAELVQIFSDSVHSGSGRTALADNNTDYYAVPLSAETSRPGTVYADPYGHILMIAVLGSHNARTGHCTGRPATFAARRIAREYKHIPMARRYALGRFSVFEARKPCAVASFSHM